METKTWAGVLALVVAFTLLAGCAQSGQYSNNATANNNSAYNTTINANTTTYTAPHYSGRAVFLASDASADMNSVSQVAVTVNSVQVHSASQGWVNLNITPRTFDLLQLRASGQTVWLADTQLSSDNYDQVRMDISNVMVTDASGTHEAKMPSGQMRITNPMYLQADHTSTVLFDFDANQSMHMTGNGEYIMAPVVRIENRDDAQVNEQSNGMATVSGGSVSSASQMSMDVDGNMGAYVGIPANANLTIVGGVVRIGSGTSSGSAGVYGSGNANGGASGTYNGNSGASGSASGSAGGSVSANYSAPIQDGTSTSDLDVGTRMRIGVT